MSIINKDGPFANKQIHKNYEKSSPNEVKQVIHAGLWWVIGIDTKIEVIVVLPTTWEAHHSPRAWSASHVVGDTTMTEIEVSISILSWCLKAY